MKIEINEVAQTLQDLKLSPDVIRKALEALNLKVEEAKAEREPAEPKGKNQLVVILYDKDGHLAKTAQTFTATIVQIEEGVAASEGLTRLKQAAHDFNANTRKGKKNPLKSVAEAAQYAGRKQTKANKVMVKNREVVEVIVSNNSLV